MSSSDSEEEKVQTKTTHVIKPSKEKVTLDTSNWPLLLKVSSLQYFISISLSKDT